MQGKGIDTRTHARKASGRSGLQISEHFPIMAFDIPKNFVDSRKHLREKPKHPGDLTLQLLYVPLALV